MQGTQVQSLVQEDPTFLGAIKALFHNYRSARATTTEAVGLELMLQDKRSHHNEEPTHLN